MFLYRLVTFIYFIFVLPLKLIIFKETRTYIQVRLRSSKKNLDFDEANVYVFHASSGEAEYAFPIIRELKDQRPNCKIIMTFFSNSYVDALNSNPDIDQVIPLPLDLPGPTYSFLKRSKARAVFISRTDLWPELLTQAQKLDTPVVLFSRTQVPINNILKRMYYRWIFKKLTFISVVSLDDKKYVLNVHPQANVFVHGDSRWDQVQFKLAQNPSVHF